MKIFNPVIIVLILFQFGNAQDTIRIEDILNRTGKHQPIKKTPKRSNVSSNSADVLLDLFKEAIEPYIYNIEIQYHLLKDNKVYGKGETEYFGSVFTVGINTKNKLLIDPNALEPWKSDLDFENYKDEYTPEISRIKIDEIDKSSNNYYNKDEFTAKVKENALGIIDTRGKIMNAVEISESQNETGFLITYSKVNATSKLESSMAYMNPNWISDRCKIPDTDENMIGGFFFQFKLNNGTISLLLSGIVIKSLNGRVELIRVSDHSTPSEKTKSKEKINSTDKKPTLKEIIPKNK